MNDNYEQVLTVLNNYMKGTYMSNVPLLRSLFHKDAHMTGYLGDDLLIGIPEPFFTDMAQGQSMKVMGCPYKGQVVSLSVNDRIASAVVREDGFRGSVTLENHFQLLHEDGKWLIISKNFTTLR